MSGMLRAAAEHSVPFGTRVWARIHSGEAKGLWLKLDPRWHRSYLEGSHETGIQSLLRDLLRPGDAFYDVGAHIGFFSIIAARLVGRDGRVFAFEAAPENVEALEQNARKNDLRQIVINPVAIWSKCGNLTFGRPYSGALAGAILDASCQGSCGPECLQIQVPTITLDHFAESHCAPKVIKIDVEGAEAEVLKGATRLVEQSRPALICEVHNQPAAASVQAWLANNGYQFEWMAGGGEFPRHLVAHPQSVAHIAAGSIHEQIASNCSEPDPVNSEEHGCPRTLGSHREA
jgi:FkbM family methyltransferase